MLSESLAIVRVVLIDVLLIFTIIVLILLSKGVLLFELLVL